MNKLVRIAAVTLSLVACDRTPPAASPASAAPAPLPEPQKEASTKDALKDVPKKVTTAEEIVVPTLTLSASAGDLARGKQLFSDKGCTTCHVAIGGIKALGPELEGVTARRSLVYIERMMLRPDIMIRTDPTAKQLFEQYSVPMTNQRIDPDKELPFLVDYLGSLEKKGP